MFVKVVGRAARRTRATKTRSLAPLLLSQR